MSESTARRLSMTAILLATALLASTIGLMVEADQETNEPREGPPGRVVLLEVSSTTRSVPTTIELHMSCEPSSGQDLFQEVVKLADGSATVALPVAPTATCRVRAFAPGCWSAPVLIDGSLPGTHRLMLWPAGDLKGRVLLPAGAEHSNEIRVRLDQRPGLGKASSLQPSAPAEVVCPLDNQQAIQCSVPAGRWNARLELAPFAPYSLVDIETEPGQSLDVGTLKLKRGGTVFGEIRTEQGSVDPRRARVWLQPLVETEPTEPAERARFRERVMRGEVMPDGFFQVVGVPSGTYELKASNPGFIIASRSPIQAEAGKWTELEDPVVLESPLQLTVELMPNAELSGRPWSIELYSVDGSGRERLLADGKTDEGGFWESPPTAAGKYRVRVLDSEQNALMGREIELDRQSQNLVLEIPLVFVEGEVVLAGQPLEAVLWFGGRTGAENVEVRSSESGEFFAVLPRDGDWSVDVQAESPPVRSRGLQVEVERIDGLDVAEVRVEVPNTSILGEVVDENGLPLRTPAHVHILALNQRTGVTGTESDSRGEFEVHGMPTGRYTVVAETDAASSDLVTVQVGESLAPVVRLTLRARRTIAGRVISDSGPVQGARVLAYPLLRTGEGLTRIETSLTAANGDFDVVIPARGELVRLVVMAPGYALATITTSERTGLSVPVGRQEGTIVLEGGGGSPPKKDRSTVSLLMINGEPLDMPRVLEWSRAHDEWPKADGSLSIPGMPPGQYALCHLPIQEAMLVIDGAALPSQEACVTGYLTSGGELSLLAR